MKREEEMLHIPERILWRIDDENAVLFDEDEGAPFLLNPTATEIWRLVDEGNSAEAIVTALHHRYTVPPEEQIRIETMELIDGLRERKLLEV